MLAVLYTLLFTWAYRFSHEEADIYDMICSNMQDLSFFMYHLCVLAHVRPVFFIPATLKSAGYYVIPSVLKICPPVSASFSFSVLSIFLPIFFKLCIRVDIWMKWVGIVISTELWPLTCVRNSFSLSIFGTFYQFSTN